MTPNLYPVCPHCGADPLTMATVTLQIGAAEMLIIFCGNPVCRKAFNTHVLRIERNVLTLDNVRPA